MKKNFLLGGMVLASISFNSWGFSCKDSSGSTISDSDGYSTVYVNLSPTVEVGRVLVMDLSKNLTCSNSHPDLYNDYIKITSGTGYVGGLESFEGSFRFYGSTYPLPYTGSTKEHNIKSREYIPLDIITYLKPISAANGVIIKKGDTLATINLFKRATWVGDDSPAGNMSIEWTVKASNDVVIPVGGCDVSSRNVAVTLPDYPGTETVPLTARCAQEQRLSYYLSGTTVDTASTIFTNTSSNNPAIGVGVQLSNRNGVIAANKNVSLGTVGISPVSLGLTASYARTSDKLVAGNVQSIIGVTFVYE